MNALLEETTVKQLRGQVMKSLRGNVISRHHWEGEIKNEVWLQLSVE